MSWGGFWNRNSCLTALTFDYETNTISVWEDIVLLGGRESRLCSRDRWERKEKWHIVSLLFPWKETDRLVFPFLSFLPVCLSFLSFSYEIFAPVFTFITFLNSHHGQQGRHLCLCDCYLDGLFPLLFVLFSWMKERKLRKTLSKIGIHSSCPEKKRKSTSRYTSKWLTRWIHWITEK